MHELPRITVRILGSEFDMGVDTQASVNAISAQAYRSMAIKPDLIPSDALIYAYDGKRPMALLGKFKAIVNANDRRVEADFF